MIWISFLANELGCSTEPGKGLVWNPQDLSYIRLNTVCLPASGAEPTIFRGPTEKDQGLCFKQSSKHKKAFMRLRRIDPDV
jgi:hypothetical protein